MNARLTPRSGWRLSWIRIRIHKNKNKTNNKVNAGHNILCSSYERFIYYRLLKLNIFFAELFNNFRFPSLMFDLICILFAYWMHFNSSLECPYCCNFSFSETKQRRNHLTRQHRKNFSPVSFMENRSMSSRDWMSDREVDLPFLSHKEIGAYFCVRTTQTQFHVELNLPHLFLQFVFDTEACINWWCWRACQSGSRLHMKL